MLQPTLEVKIKLPISVKERVFKCPYHLGVSLCNMIDVGVQTINICVIIAGGRGGGVRVTVKY